ncbi:hypothetical protein, partial [Pseudomonas aeruginosa]|uniref:hypothetical protein n=1 Tax=Pseudomonas aeruginosa TaxID=287 RepID=UPI001CA4FA9B
MYTNLQESSLYQFVRTPTRGNNVLDIVLATKEELIENLNVGDEFSNSDHRTITFSLKFTSNGPDSSIEKVPNFKQATFLKLRAMFKETGWSFLIN